MIVNCEKCNSKFQVDDAKIPEAGIKGRCSVCAHVFILKKLPAAAEPASDKNRVDTVVAPRIITDPAVSNNVAAHVPVAPNVFSSASTPPVADSSSFTAGDDEVSFSGWGTMEAKEDVPAVAKPARQAEDEVFEIEEWDQLEDADEVCEAEEVDEADDFSTVFAAETEDGKATAAHEAFANFVAQQKTVEETSADARTPVTARAGTTANDGFAPVSERIQSQPALERSTVPSAQHPEIVAGGQWPIRPGSKPKTRPGHNGVT